MNNYVEKRVQPAFAYYGGKWVLCHQILQMSPPHTTYVECFAGGLNVLLNKFKSEVEVACDIDGELINFYHVLIDDPEFLIDRIHQVEFCRKTLDQALIAKNKGDEITRAINFLIRIRMAYSGCGKWANDVRKERAWKNLPDNLRVVAGRLKEVKMVYKSAFDVIQEYDSPNTWFYADPPYYQPTRVSLNMYVKELSEMGHLKLLRLLKSVKGKVILSGYANPMYDKELAGWDRVEVGVSVRSSPRLGGKAQRTEIFWVKPEPMLA